ncbi:MAG: hypothetical protein H6622_01860 [Halobacteriovoraceae bacterium]|nr:hypothetical protein [Halobacteriovoraceae bacterium]
MTNYLRILMIMSLMIISIDSYSMKSSYKTAKNGMKVCLEDGLLVVSDHGIDLKKISTKEFNFQRVNDLLINDNVIIFQKQLAADPGGYPSKIDVEEYIEKNTPQRAFVDFFNQSLNLSKIVIDEIVLKF